MSTKLKDMERKLLAYLQINTPEFITTRQIPPSLDPAVIETLYGLGLIERGPSALFEGQVGWRNINGGSARKGGAPQIKKNGPERCPADGSRT